MDTRGPVGLPAHGAPLSDVKARLREARARSRDVFERGDIVYPSGDEVHEAARAGLDAFFQGNVHYRGLFPSAVELEDDLVRMAIDLFHGGEGARGTLTSGGTESILLAVKSARDRARAQRPTDQPKILVSTSAHPAFARAAEYFGLELITVPLGDGYSLDVDAYLRALTDDVVLMVGSAPSYPTGLVDPVRTLAAFAAERNVPFHVDGCLGGFFLPFAERLGAKPAFPDFRLPGVTTISADFHKFGYASTKGVSVIVHRDETTYRHQVFSTFMGKGSVRYETEGMRGSRSAGPVAAAWAVTRVLGEDGYLRRAGETLELMETVKREITAIEGLRLVSEPVAPLILYTSDEIDIFSVSSGMSERGWAMHQDDFPRPLIRSLWPWGMRDYVGRYMRDLSEVVGLVRSGVISVRAETSY